MDVEQAREFLLGLSHVEETQQWGDNLVFWVGDKAIGGKMFVLLNLGGDGSVVSYPAGAERFHNLVERDGLKPAPYFARIFWVAADGWDAWRNVEWQQEFRAAHAMTLARLPKKVVDVLALPARERAKLVAEQRLLLTAKAKKKT